MAKCKYETSNGRCGLKDCYAYRHKCYTEEFCKCHRPQTNADRIRAMSDEELAKIIEHELGCPVTGDCAKMSKDCKVCWLDWLQQPSE